MGWPRHRSVNSASQTIVSHMGSKIFATGKTKVGGKLHLYSFTKFVLPVEYEKHMPRPTKVYPWEIWPTLSIYIWTGAKTASTCPRDADGLEKRRRAPVLSLNNDARTLGWNNNRVTARPTATCSTPARDTSSWSMYALDVPHCQLSLLVSSVGLVSGAIQNGLVRRTFDLSGDILACLGQTDWHYFEPCKWWINAVVMILSVPHCLCWLFYFQNIITFLFEKLSCAVEILIWSDAVDFLGVSENAIRPVLPCSTETVKTYMYRERLRKM